MTRMDWILTGDLNDGDRVIVAGLQKVKPGDQPVVTLSSTADSGVSRQAPAAKTPPGQLH
jgi:membrane fusion protein, multidrug efflux system